MNDYIAKLKHDNGTITLYVKATSEENAKELICKAEGCPKCAIYSIRKITKRF